MPTQLTPTTPAPSRWRARAAAGALAAAALVALAGCQTGTGDAPEAGATSSAPSATAATSPTPSDDAEPTAGTSVGTTTIESPAAGSTVAGPAVTVSGTATAFEATLLYLVRDAGGATVASGFTTAGANGEIGPFAIDLTLDAGAYTVQVWEPGMDENDASAPPVNLAEVTFTVG